MKNFKFKINGENYEVAVQPAEDNKVQVDVNGKAYLVELEEQPAPQPTVAVAPQPIAPAPSPTAKPAAATAPAAKTATSATSLKSPLPGSIIKVVVKAGDTVKDGDVILVMESMKMENNITAEQSGTITAIHVVAGQSVMQDDPLVDIA